MSINGIYGGLPVFPNKKCFYDILSDTITLLFAILVYIFTFCKVVH